MAHTTAGIVEAPPGSGLYATTLTAPEDSGQYSVVWNIGPNPEDYGREDLIVAPGFPIEGYPSAPEIVADSSIDELTSLTEAEQDALWRSAIGEIEEYTGQRFNSVTETRLVDGQGGRELYLPARLEAITAIAFPGNEAAWRLSGWVSGLTFADVLLDPEFDKLVVKSSAGLGYYSQTLLQLQPGNGRMEFPYGQDSVEIAGTWGWSSFPPAVRDAIRLDMEDQAIADSHQLSSNIRAYRKLGIKNMSQSGLAVAVALGQPGLSPQVMRLLEPYRWQPALGKMI
jgi:hypothetical protein